MSYFTIKITSNDGKVEVDIDTDDEAGGSLAHRIGTGLVAHLSDQARDRGIKTVVEIVE